MDFDNSPMISNTNSSKFLKRGRLHSRYILDQIQDKETEDEQTGEKSPHLPF